MNKSLFDEKFADLVETARDYRNEAVIDDFKAINALLDLCYKLEYVNDIKRWAPMLPQEQSTPEKSTPKADLSPEATALKNMIKNTSTAQQASIEDITPQTPAQAPKKPAKIENARYIDSSYSTHFTDPFIEVFQRNVKRKDGTIYEAYATIDKNGRRVDVSFATSLHIEELRYNFNEFFPAQCEIQNKNGFARLYITQLVQSAGVPMCVEEI